MSSAAQTEYALKVNAAEHKAAICNENMDNASEYHYSQANNVRQRSIYQIRLGTGKDSLEYAAETWI